jgi:hypothetical protein
MDSEEDPLIFISKTNNQDIINNGTHKVERESDFYQLQSINGKLFLNDSILSMLLSIILSIPISSFASLPYLACHDHIVLGSTMIKLCSMRMLAYFLIFSVYWIYYINILFSGWKPGSITIISSIKHLICFLFSVTYSILYSIKWLEIEGVMFWKFTIPLFSISWFLNYYSIIDKQVGSFGSSTGSLNSKRRNALITNVKNIEALCYESEITSITIANEIIAMPCASLLMARLTRANFCNIEEEKLEIYDSINFDFSSSARTNIVNIFLGISLVALSISMIEDYGYSLKSILKTTNENIFLWVAIISCCSLAIMYMIATYPIHHKTAKTIFNAFLFFKSERCVILKKFIYRIPFSIISILIASVRMNASYSIFGRIAAKFQFPYCIGMSFIWVSTILVFMIDYGACMKSISWSSKKAVSIVCYIIFSRFARTNKSRDIGNNISLLQKAIRGFLSKYFIRYHTKRLKRIIRTCNDEELFELSKYLI